MRCGVALAAAIALAGPGQAQYDRDGRYVPSPLGVPADPYARPIPNYPGTPGGAIGTPSWPRAVPAPPPAGTILPRPVLPYGRATAPWPQPVLLRICREGWSKSTGLSRVEYNRACRQTRQR